MKTPRPLPGPHCRPRHPSVLVSLAAALLLALAGCASMPRMLGGGGGDVALTLDGDQKHETSMAKGRTLRLDLRDPSAKGYAMAGTLFNPALLRLDGIEHNENGRIHYLFRAMAPGDTDVIIKIRPLSQPQAAAEVFKHVRVVVE